MSTAGKYGTKRETFAKVSAKARQHASKNPYALFNQVLSVEEVLASEEVFDPLTRYQCCPPTCGAAAAIVCSGRVREKDGNHEAHLHCGQAMVTDRKSSFDEDSMIKMVGYDMTKGAAQKVYEESASVPRTFKSSSSTTASPPTKSSPTKVSVFAARARRRNSSKRAKTRTGAST